jgi:hypothetical protein
MPHARVVRFIAVAVPVLAAVACGTFWSVHPLFVEKDLVAAPALVGVWTDVANPGGERLVLLHAPDTSKSYVLAAADSTVADALFRANLEALFTGDSATRAKVDRDPVARARRDRDSALVAQLRTDAHGPRWFDVRLGRLNGVLFADISPMPLADSEPRLGRSLQIPAHWFWRVSLEGDRLRVVPLDESWLGRMIDSGKVRIAHEKEEGNVVLTAPSGELQRLVARYALDTAAFPKKHESEYRRSR